MCPRSGFSSPRQSFRIVLLPDPATPRITLVSPRRNSKETPSSTGTPSKAMATSSKMIALCTVSTDLLSSGSITGSAHSDEELGKDGVDREYEHRGHDHCLGSGTAYALRAALGGHPVITPHGGDNETKYQRLYHAGDNIIVLQHLVSAVPVLIAVQAEHEEGDDPSTNQADQIGNDGEKEHHENRGENARGHQ